ncbi:hypothetical protein L195_g038392, partial [Trifolium pratense]
MVQRLGGIRCCQPERVVLLLTSVEICRSQGAWTVSTP